MEAPYYHLAFWKQGSNLSLLNVVLDHYAEARVGLVKAQARVAGRQWEPVSDNANWAELRRLASEDEGVRVFIKNRTWIGRGTSTGEETNYRRDYGCEEGQMIEFVTSSVAWDPERGPRQFKDLAKKFEQLCRLLDPDYGQLCEEMSLESPYEFSGEVGELMFIAEPHLTPAWNKVTFRREECDPKVVGRIIQGLRQPGARHVLNPFWYTGMEFEFPA